MLETPCILVKNSSVNLAEYWSYSRGIEWILYIFYTRGIWFVSLFCCCFLQTKWRTDKRTTKHFGWNANPSNASHQWCISARNEDHLSSARGTKTS